MEAQESLVWIEAAREWHKALVVLSSELSFDRCHSGPALFESNVGKCFIFLLVDDLLIFSEKKLLQPLVDRILAKFDGRDLKELHHVFGMEVKRDREAKTLSISHKQKITELLDSFNCPILRSTSPSDSCCALSVKVWMMPFHWQNSSSEYDLNSPP